MSRKTAHDCAARPFVALEGVGWKERLLRRAGCGRRALPRPVDVAVERTLDDVRSPDAGHGVPQAPGSLALRGHLRLLATPGERQVDPGDGKEKRWGEAADGD